MCFACRKLEQGECVAQEEHTCWDNENEEADQDNAGWNCEEKDEEKDSYPPRPPSGGGEGGSSGSRVFQHAGRVSSLVLPDERCRFDLHANGPSPGCMYCHSGGMEYILPGEK